MRRTRVNTRSICKKFSLLFITKDGPFPRYVFTLYTAPVVLLERRVTEEDEEEVVAEGERVRVSSLFVFSLKTPAFFAFVKSEAHFGVKAAAAAAQKTFSNFIRERERERENVGGGGEENDINEH